MTHKLTEIVTRDLDEAARSYHRLAMSVNEIEPLIRELAETASASLQAGGALFFAGNGGSFADAQHMAAEFSGKLSRERKPLRAIALGTNSSSMSAIGNDFGFVHIFSRELEAFGKEGDVVVAFSTSGSSENLVELGKSSGKIGAKFWSFTGENRGTLENFGTSIKVPSIRTERIQEMHTTLGHILCLLIEEQLGIFK